MSDDLQLLVGKIMTDEDFAEALSTNPEQALKDAGIDPNVDLVERLKGIDPAALKQLANNFGADGAAV